MPDPMTRSPWLNPAASIVGVVVTAVVAAACVSTPSPIPSPSATASSTPSAQPTTTASPTVTLEPTATPAPPLSLALPEDVDARRIRVGVAPDMPADDSGRMVVTVVNLSDERVTELVLRWATDLRETHLIAPFEPSELRIVEGGPPLLQPWTKWVDGPGERGEPAGTTSLGWGPLDPGATLTIPLLVIRRAVGGTAFDFQVLAGEALLTLEAGGPAELRVELP